MPFCSTSVPLLSRPFRTLSAPVVQIFRTYISIELTLAEVDRCRHLYEKYLEWAPSSCYAWTKFAELERTLNEFDRARGIFELAIAQPVLDTPELLWKAYIDFEIGEGEYARARELYERLLNRTKHVKVGILVVLFVQVNKVHLGRFVSIYVGTVFTLRVYCDLEPCRLC